MKSLYKFIFAAAASGFLAVSCSEEPDYTPGTPDLADCYGVYFPSQENLTDHELEPMTGLDKSHSIEFTVKRLKTEDAIIVPYEITSSAENMFTGSQIKFSEGESETTFEVTLSGDAEIGVTYNCNISISDPAYALNYSQYSSLMDFSAIVVKWNRVTGGNGEQYGWWRDDLMSVLFGIDAVENKEVIFEERDDKPGYFRLTNVYRPEDWGTPLGVSAAALNSYFDTGAQIIVDATNAGQVYIPYQSLGVEMSWAGVSGYLQIVPYSDRVLSIDSSESLYGIYDESAGIIEFPENAFYVAIGGSLYAYGNPNGLFRIVLPGYAPADYSVTLSPGLSEGGEVGIGYTFGDDVSAIRYEVYSGKLSEAAAEEAAGEIEKDSGASRLSSPSGTITVSDLGETGIYTIVTANYDAGGVFRSYSYRDFTFIKDGDTSKAVKMTVELQPTDQYSYVGYTSENSLKVYIAGEDIQQAYYYFDKGRHWGDSTIVQIENYLKRLVEEGSDSIYLFDDDVVSEINDYGFLNVLTGLAPGAEYCLMVYAFNGYQWNARVATGKTSGTYSIIYDSFSRQSGELAAMNSPSDFVGTYDYYAVNLLGTSGVREKIGTVKITDAGNYVLSVEGLMGPAASTAGLASDAIDFTYSRGYCYSETTYYESGSEPATYLYDGTLPLYLAPAYIGSYGSYMSVDFGLYSSSLGAYLNLLAAGRVTGIDGTEAIAFDDNHQAYENYIYNGREYDFRESYYSYSGIALCGYNGEYFTSIAKIFSAYEDMLLLPQSGYSAAMPSGTASPEPVSALPAARHGNAMRLVRIDGMTRDAEPVAFKSRISASVAEPKTPEVTVKDDFRPAGLIMGHDGGINVNPRNME